jgi:hypothetical protein
MNAVLESRHLIPQGLAGRKFRKAPQPFDNAVIAAVNPDGALAGHAIQKQPKTLADDFDASNTVVDLGAHSAFLHLEEAGALIDGIPPAIRTPRLNASASDPRAALTSPPDGAVLAPVQTFTWNAGYLAREYYIWIGSCFDCTDILEQNMALARSVQVYLPTDGRLIFVTLFTYYNGYWYWFDYTFAASNGVVPAQLTAPANGSTLAASQSFSWSTGYAVDDYQIWVGSCQDCTDILGEDEGHRTSRTVALPTDGRTIYVTLFSWIGGQWYWFDYQYRAASQPPRAVKIVVTNRLDYPVDVLVNGESVGSVSAANTQYADVTVGSLTVSFNLIRPTLSGRALGDEMAGIYNTITNPSGTYYFEVNNVISQQSFFEPLVTNLTSVPLEIEVNGGLQAENRCNCVAPAGSSNVAPGYYRLYSNGNIRLFRGDSNYTSGYWFWGTDSNGRVASGGILPGYVEAQTGRARFTATTAP